MDPLDILPAELWGMIFEKVEEPQDWLNLYRMSSTFEGIVGKERPSALLSKVFPHVQKHLSLKANLRELLGLRLVSPQWRQLVDSALETPEEFGTDVREHDQEWMYEFTNSVRVSTFLEQFSAHPGNPFIGRTVRVVFSHHIINDEETMAEFERGVFQLMERFGEHIRSLYVVTQPGTNVTGLSKILRRLQTILALVPNLESLIVPILGTEGVDYRLDNPVVEDPQQFPVILNLKYFVLATTIKGQWELLAKLQSLMVRLCCNPVTLKGAKLIGVPSQLATYPNMDTAELSVTSHLGDLGIPSNTSWPLLTRLTVHPDPAMELHQVHDCLKHFRETLTDLTIASPWKRVGKEMLKFDLPHLKYLQLTVHPEEFDLLTSLSNLESLTISPVELSSRAELSEEALLRLVTDRMERGIMLKKMWQVHPKLRKIQLDGFLQAGGAERKTICKVFSREKYVWAAGVSDQ